MKESLSTPQVSVLYPRFQVQTSWFQWLSSDYYLSKEQQQHPKRSLLQRTISFHWHVLLWPSVLWTRKLSPDLELRYQFFSHLVPGSIRLQSFFCCFLFCEDESSAMCFLPSYRWWHPSGKGSSILGFIMNHAHVL